MATFIGIHKGKNSDYGVCFPDFPGCVTAGITLDNAMEMSSEALCGHIVRSTT
jgi:predicted RNase H-like HicB family nuclease